MRKLLTSLVSCLALLVASTSPASGHDQAVSTVVLFHIAKSNNRNRVEYAAKVRPDCRFDADEPLTVYWRRLEQGPEVTRPLKWVEEKFAYGINVRQRSAERLEFTIAADDSRPVTVMATPAPMGGCDVRAWLHSLGEPGITDYAFVEMKPRRMLFPRIYWVDLHTIRTDGTRVCERVTERGRPGEPCPLPMLRAPAPASEQADPSRHR